MLQHNARSKRAKAPEPLRLASAGQDGRELQNGDRDGAAPYRPVRRTQAVPMQSPFSSDASAESSPRGGARSGAAAAQGLLDDEGAVAHAATAPHMGANLGAGRVSDGGEREHDGAAQDNDVASVQAHPEPAQQLDGWVHR